MGFSRSSRCRFPVWSQRNGADGPSGLRCSRNEHPAPHNSPYKSASHTGTSLSSSATCLPGWATLCACDRAPCRRQLCQGWSALYTPWQTIEFELGSILWSFSRTLQAGRATQGAAERAPSFEKAPGRHQLTHPRFVADKLSGIEVSSVDPVSIQ